ncbi:aldolase/citrate lyase family protein [Nocardia nova]|uniref:aldolase/citrate lyase family protein n=1 Tax=Nocardia nova TaxID=37330 RepID=UPI000CE9DBFA|nr:aldolase/citrate lyase family protein [Nocardia nova]PPI94151.1 2-dehydro-3-deoxyglucarate aldolase [Nocardia nova]PPJ12233.1 2-dehydro-3-deoxyglucarate aldolase [Nocardia nova]
MRNRWRQALTTGRTQIGMWVVGASPYSAEICAGAGLDWLLIDQEHAPNDLRSTLSQLQAVSGYPVEVLVRPPSADPVLIKQLLDLGVTDLVVPMIESAAAAQAVVAATRYPPAGIRGVGSAFARASRWNRISDYLTTADSSISVTVQIESAAGLAELDKIAGVEGVDAVFIGPADLAASLGYLGKPQAPPVVEVIEEALRTLHGAGVAAGVNAFDPATARRYIAAGASFVLVGADVTLLARGAEALAQAYRNDIQFPTPHNI